MKIFQDVPPSPAERAAQATHEERIEAVQDAKTRYDAQPVNNSAKKWAWIVWAKRAYRAAIYVKNVDQAQEAFQSAPCGSEAKNFSLEVFFLFLNKPKLK